MNVVAIVQARMGSTRLPGKVLKKVKNVSLLEFQLARVKHSKYIDKIVVATTIKDTDDPIVHMCESMSVACYRGSEEDVLSRYYEAATLYQADAVVRLTSDCPLIDPQVIDDVIMQFLNKEKANYDYVSNCLTRTFPRGMDTEIFSYDALKAAFEKGATGSDREHVTPYIYNQPNKFRLGNLFNKEDQSKHRWTVDTPEDFELISKMIDALLPVKPHFNLEDCIQLLEKNPEWLEINKHIEQKKL